MNARRNSARAGATFTATLVALVLTPAVVLAQSAGSDGTVPPHFEGPCQLSATIVENGAAIDPAASGGVYTAPMSGSATYSGSIAVPPENRAHHGSVRVVTPPGIPSITLRSWEDEDTDTVADSGSVSWDLPAVLPRGIVLTVEGFHEDTGGTCEGSIKVKLEGGILDSPVGIASLAMTALTGVALGAAALPRIR